MFRFGRGGGGCSVLLSKKVQPARNKTSWLYSKNRAIPLSTNLVQVWTDGACSGAEDQRVAGIGVYFGAVDDKRNVSERLAGERQTNQRAELAAAVRALREVPLQHNVQIDSDSSYVVKGATDWLWNWKATGWVTAAKKEITNLDLWQELDEELAKRTAAGTQVLWKQVVGHGGDMGNIQADNLAVQGSKKKPKAMVQPELSSTAGQQQQAGADTHAELEVETGHKKPNKTKPAKKKTTAKKTTPKKKSQLQTPGEAPAAASEMETAQAELQAAQAEVAQATARLQAAAFRLQAVLRC
eukprot:TRINITY_DN67832_c3_g1_i1.p1 TRINITY_DN67832_c3_g1~~TRINITY_DN67832_c3_g1_i1.p1  ORF type:complete len:298 (-),score=38.00 TRINITY_DN67832_c3_g1_i1:45-938(-)